MYYLMGARVHMHDSNISSFVLRTYTLQVSMAITPSSNPWGLLGTPAMNEDEVKAEPVQSDTEVEGVAELQYDDDDNEFDDNDDSDDWDPQFEVLWFQYITRSFVRCNVFYDIVF
jgi:hypothetical protein